MPMAPLAMRMPPTNDMISSVYFGKRRQRRVMRTRPARVQGWTARAILRIQPDGAYGSHHRAEVSSGVYSPGAPTALWRRPGANDRSLTGRLRGFDFISSTWDRRSLLVGQHPTP